MEPEVIGTIGVLANRSNSAVLKILGFRGDKINIVGEYYSGEGVIQEHHSTTVTNSRMIDSPVYDSLVDKNYTYYSEVVVPAPGRYQIINQSQGVKSSTYSSLPLTSNILPIGNSTVSGVAWDYAGEIIDVKICTYNTVDARMCITKWAGIKAIINAHKEKDCLKLGQIIEAPSGINSVTGGSAQFAVFSIDDIPGYPHAVVFGPVQPLIGPRIISGSKVTKNTGGYYATEISVYLDTTYFTSLPSELQEMITPRQATYGPGGGTGALAKTYYPETHRVWMPRLSELVMQGKNNTGSGELTKSSYYLELDGRIFGISKYCQYHPNTSTLLNDTEASSRIYYQYPIWTSSVQMGTGFATLTAGGEISYVAPNVSQTKTPRYVTPFFMISADDDSCEYHYLRMIP